MKVLMEPCLNSGERPKRAFGIVMHLFDKALLFVAGKLTQILEKLAIYPFLKRKSSQQTRK